MEVAARWSEVVRRPDDEVPLDRAALLISAAANPALDVEVQLARLDELAGRVGAPDCDELCRVLFHEVGLTGDRQRYDDPDNSYLDRVLDRRRGIPISLSVLLIEVGRRCGLRLEAVGMPGHFLVRDPARAEHLVDAFGGGRRLDRSECERLLHATAGPQVRLTPEMLATTGTHAILARMLANLDGSFGRRDDRAALGWVSELRRLLPSAPSGDRAQLAARLAALGRFDVAAGVLEDAVPHLPEGAKERAGAQARALRARLN